MFKLSIITLTFQVVAALLVLLTKRSLKTKFMFYLRIILVFTAIVELTGFIIRTKEGNPFNLYFIFTGLIFILITLMYSDIINHFEKLRVVKLLTIFLLVVFGVTFFYPITFTYLIILGAFNTSLYAFLYLRQLLMTDEILNYKELLPFWVSVGFLAFYLPSIPFFSILNYMKTRGLFFILSILVILMNTLIIYGLLCSKKEEEY